MSEKHSWSSPYSYVDDNPLRYVDIKGGGLKPVETADEIKVITQALAVVMKTSTEEYNTMPNSKEVFEKLRLVQFPSSGNNLNPALHRVPAQNLT